MTTRSPDCSVTPDTDAIAAVLQACSCDQTKAKSLLKAVKNDPDRAIKLHRILLEYNDKIDPSSSSFSLPNRAQRAASDATVAAPAQDGPANMAPSRDWNFVLPVVRPFSTNVFASFPSHYEPFNLKGLVARMQYGASMQPVSNYRNQFHRTEVEKHINDEVEGFPAIFFVVETNKEDLLRLWTSYGGDVSAVHESSGVPLLAYAIMHSDNIQADTTLMTATLLSLRALPDTIPSAFYSPYLHDLPEQGPSEERLEGMTDEQKRWCTDVARGKLARGCSLSQRYYLDRAAKTPKPSRRQQQVAERTNSEPLLGMTNFLIGQNLAAKLLFDILLAHVTEPPRKPLVLVFAGPSGHGKTEMARCLGHLLSLQLQVIDCTIVNREMELFGPRHPYVGAEKGTPLNNFLAAHENQPCIVFLDEFEKTTSDIHKALLLPFDDGEYQDRRDLKTIDCSKTIWILASNAHDAIIKDSAAANNRVLLSDEASEGETRALLNVLSGKLREDFRAHHGAPTTGRRSGFLPLLPFSLGEQSVIVHKALLELGRKVRRRRQYGTEPVQAEALRREPEEYEAQYHDGA